MDRDHAWVIPALTGLIMLGCIYAALGGSAGVSRDPGVSLAAAAIMVAITVPLLWLTYRRLRRQPIIVPITETKPNISLAEQLNYPPVVLMASRWKLLGRATFAGVVTAIFIGISLAQPGVCRVVSVGLLGPFLIWAFLLWALSLWRPNRLTLAPEGLSHQTIWTAHHWTWDEVRDIRLAKRNIPFIGGFFKKRPTASVLFKRYQPEGQIGGAAQVGVLSIWKMSGDDLAALMEAARSKWSTPEGTSYVPIRGFFKTYYPIIAIMALMAGLYWMWFTQPCAH